MQRDLSAFKTYNYGDAVYWDARYVHEAAVNSFDWYQNYPNLRPLVRNYIATSSRLLQVGCGNSDMSEDMVKDGYEDIMNVDISSVAIELMRRKYEHMPELKYMQMDVKDMSFFADRSFDTIIDKGTLDSLMCGTDGPSKTLQMLGEMRRLLVPGGIYMLITYGDPKSRIQHLNAEVCNWKIEVYIVPKPGFQRATNSSTTAKSLLEPVQVTDKGELPKDYVLEDPDSHFMYVCRKTNES